MREFMANVPDGDQGHQVLQLGVELPETVGGEARGGVPASPSQELPLGRCSTN